MDKKQEQIVKKIEKVKSQLMGLGPMRPGTLTRQFRNPKAKQGPFWQLSYTYQMKSKTEYVRPSDLPQMKIEVKNFKRFKKLTQTWVDLALKLSKEKVQQAKKTGLPNP